MNLGVFNPDQQPETGSMGLKGLFAQIGQSTAMVVMVVIAFWALFTLERNHVEAITALTAMHVSDRDYNRQVHSDLVGVIAKNTQAIDALTIEFRKGNK
jgi:hypothetical protein